MDWDRIASAIVLIIILIFFISGIVLAIEKNSIIGILLIVFSLTIVPFIGANAIQYIRK